MVASTTKKNLIGEKLVLSAVGAHASALVRHHKTINNSTPPVPANIASGLYELSYGSFLLRPFRPQRLPYMNSHRKEALSSVQQPHTPIPKIHILTIKNHQGVKSTIRPPLVFTKSACAWVALGNTNKDGVAPATTCPSNESTWRSVQPGCTRAHLGGRFAAAAAFAAEAVFAFVCIFLGRRFDVR